MASTDIQDTRQLFLWLMGCMYMLAFGSLYVQIPGMLFVMNTISGLNKLFVLFSVTWFCMVLFIAYPHLKPHMI